MCEMEGWETKKLGEISSFSKGKLTEQCSSPRPQWLPLINAEAISTETKIYANPQGALICNIEDILILWDGERAGLVTTGKIGVVGSTFVKITTNHELDALYCFYYLQNQFKWIQCRRTGTGVPHVPKDLGKILFINFPISIEVQKKIASILHKVDKNIEKTNLLISKYKQIKKGLLHDLLTYGIDSEGNLRHPQTHKFIKKKGMLVPEEWEVYIFSKHIILLNGGTPSTNNTDYWNGDIPWLSVDDFNTGKRFVLDTTKKITKNGLKNSSTRLLKTYDIIISARGSVGIIAQLGKEMAFNQSCYGIRNNSSKILNNDYIYFYLLFYFQSSGVIKTGSTFDTITKKTFDEINICLPPKTEQKKIITLLEHQDSLIASEEAQLAKLQKLKQGLMQDLLSGKIRVEIDHK